MAGKTYRVGAELPYAKRARAPVHYGGLEISGDNATLEIWTC